MRKVISTALLIVTLLCVVSVFGQTVITTSGEAINALGTPGDGSAMLDVSSTAKGMLIPRMTSTQRLAIPTPAIGLLVYQTSSPDEGFWYKASSGWIYLNSSATSWAIIGNAGTVDGVNFIGTTDNVPLAIRVNNTNAGRIDNLLFNSFYGYQCGNYNTSGFNNTASGYRALYANTIGNYNTAIGMYALSTNIGGLNGVAVGYNSQRYVNPKTTNWDNTNTSLGFQSLCGSTTPINNTGGFNTAIGREALLSNTSGNQNTATGYQALAGNTNGGQNTAYGYQSLLLNSSGNLNTAVGMYALNNNTKGFENCAGGFQSLSNNTKGYKNTAYGNNALLSNKTGFSNTAIGYSADVSADGLHNATAIGSGTVVNASDKVRIGNTSVTVIEGQQMYTVSDARFKDQVSSNGVLGLDFIVKLKAVTYSLNLNKLASFVGEDTKGREKELERLSQKRTAGFLAQDVQKAMKESGFTAFDAVHVPTSELDNYSLSYAQFVVPLVKAVQELNDKNRELQMRLDVLEKIVKAKQK